MPELGKATYTLVLNSAQFDTGMAKAEARAAAATNGIAASVGKADASVSSLGPTSQRTAAQVGVAGEQMEMSFEEVGVAAGAAGAAATAGAAEIGAAAGKAAAASEAGAARTVSAWKRASTAMATTGKKMRGIGRGMTQKFTLPAALVTGVGVKMALDYGEQIQLLESQAGATAEEMEHMNKAVMDMAATGKFIHGPQELAKALFHIESVGFRGAEALSVLKTASEGAMVGGAGLEETTNALVGAQKTQIKGTETVASTMAILNAAIGMGNLRMDEMTSALGTGLANAAKGAGISLADVLGALDVLTQQGIPAVQGATKLAQSLATIQSPSEKATKALKQLGLGRLELADVLRDKGFPAALDLLAHRLSGITDPSKRAAIVLDIFSRRAGKTMLTLLNDIEGVHTAVDGIGASVKKFPDLVKKEQTEAINRLRASWVKLSVALIQLGNAAIPVVLKIADAVVKVVKAFQALPGPVKATVIVMVALLAVLGPILSMLGFMVIGIGGLITAGGALVTAVTAVKVAMMEMAIAGSTGILGLVPAFAAATAAAMILLWAIRQVDSAMDREEKSFEATVTDKSIATDLFNRQYGRYIAKGMSPKAARAKATADAAAYRKRSGSGGGENPFTDAPLVPKVPKAPGVTLPVFNLPDGKGGGKKKKRKGSTSGELLPIGIRTRQTMAERTRYLRDDLKVAQEEQAFYQKLLRNRKLRGEKRLEVERALTAVMNNIDSLIEQMESKKKFYMPRFRQRLKAAKGTEQLKDDLRVWRDEMAYLKQLLKNKKLSLAQRAAINKQIEATHKKIETIKRKQAEEQERHFRRLKELQAVMDLRGSFFSEFAGNIFGQSAGGLTLNVTGQKGGDKNLTVNQENNYNEIPRNRFGHARQMQKAASATMESM